MWSRTRVEILIVGTACLLVLGCTAFLAAQRRSPGSVAEAVRGARPAGEHDLVFVLQARDCESSLSLLQAMDRPHLRDRVRVTVLLAGPGGEVPRARARFARDLPRVRFRRLESRQFAALSALGHRQTPYWVLLDPPGVVIGSGGSPRGPREMVETIRGIEALVQGRS